MMLLVLFLLTLLFQNANCFCGGSHLHGKLTEAVVQVSNWLREYHHGNNILLQTHITGTMMASLRLAGHLPKTILLDFTTNGSITFEESLKMYLDKHQKEDKNLSKIPTGQLANIALGVLSLCHNPQNFYGYDLVKALADGLKLFKSSDFDNYFQYSSVALALCHSEDKILKKVVGKLVFELEKGQRCLSNRGSQMPDTSAMAIMALSCLTKNVVVRNEMRERKRQVDKLILKFLGNIGGGLWRHENRFWNIHSKALVVQAMMAVPSYPKPKNWHCKKLIREILEKQDETGSFGSVLANIQVLPALLGRSLVNLGHLSCPHDSHLKKKQISVCINVTFQDHHSLDQPAPPPQMNLTVPEKTTAFEILMLAAEKHDAYKYEAVKTSYGRMITAISGVKQDPATGFYWALYSSENTLASNGVDLFTPEDGSCVIFRYENSSLCQRDTTGPKNMGV